MSNLTSEFSLPSCRHCRFFRENKGKGFDFCDIPGLSVQKRCYAFYFACVNFKPIEESRKNG
jgi:hypothetical protein